MATWKVVVGTARGDAHRSQGLPNQDAAEFFASGSWLVAVVCDGAGSSTRSEQGARHAARFVSQRLGKLLADSEESGSIQGDWESHVISTIESARETLREELDAREANLSPFHATLVGAISGPDRGLFFHIGDGLGTASVLGRWDQCIRSEPEQGEYADLTFFYTQDNWREHLRFTPFTMDDIDLIVLMSDGAMAFAASKGGKGLAPEFIGPVSKFLKAEDAQTGARALSTTLDNPKTYAITGDDKTLLWAYRLKD
jgi:hypothetical protein